MRTEGLTTRDGDAEARGNLGSEAGTRYGLRWCGTEAE